MAAVSVTTALLCWSVFPVELEPAPAGRARLLIILDGGGRVGLPRGWPGEQFGQAAPCEEFLPQPASSLVAGRVQTCIETVTDAISGAIATQELVPVIDADLGRGS